MELDIRDGKPTKVEAIRYADTKLVTADANSYNVVNNTGTVILNIQKDQINNFIAALQAAIKLLG